MPDKLISSLILLLLFITSTAALGKSSDQDAPLTIEADKLEIREQDNLSIYTGNVKVTRGSLIITGDRIVIRSKNNSLYSVNINGKPATFFQLNDLDEEISAQSHEMDYLAGDGLLELKKEAILVKNNNRFSSDHIVYDTRRDIIKAGFEDSRQAGKKSRVKITILPTKNSEKDNNTP